MKKWFLFKVTYSGLSDFSDDTEVEFISEEEVENVIPQTFYMSDEYGLQIFELSPDGKKVERDDLSQKIVENRNKNFYDDLN